MIDLTKIEPPAIVEELDFEAILSRKIERFRSIYPDWNAALESDPIMKLLELASYDEMQFRARVNHAARSRLLAFAQSTDLDHLAALMGVERQILIPADPDAIPPVTEVKEEDDRLRYRTQLAPEGLSCAGPRDSYIFHAMAASGQVADVYPERTTPGTVVLYILKNSEDGVADQALLKKVSKYVNAERIRPLNDTVITAAAKPRRFSVEAQFEFEPGPDKQIVLQRSREELERLLKDKRRVGATIALSAIYHALHGTGVVRVCLSSPKADIVCAVSEYPICDSIALTISDQ